MLIKYGNTPGQMLPEVLPDFPNTQHSREFSRTCRGYLFDMGFLQQRSRAAPRRSCSAWKRRGPDGFAPAGARQRSHGPRESAPTWHLRRRVSGDSSEWRREKRSGGAPARPETVTPPRAASGCRIEGDISAGGERIRHLPGSRDDDRAGARMLCRGDEEGGGSVGRTKRSRGAFSAECTLPDRGPRRRSHTNAEA